jgi:hypothetical protein
VAAHHRAHLTAPCEEERELGGGAFWHAAASVGFSRLAGPAQTQHPVSGGNRLFSGDLRADPGRWQAGAVAWEQRRLRPVTDGSLAQAYPIRAARGTGGTTQARVAPEASHATERLAGADLRKCGTALLVDDEERVRLSTADMLGEPGSAVVEAASGEAALRMVERGERFDLLVTDHLMPGPTGTGLPRAVRACSLMGPCGTRSTAVI